MVDNERNFLAYADITLSNNTVLHLTNSEIWAGGFSYEDAVSEDENFTALGSVIMGSAEVVINNIYETYSQYDFMNADVILWIGLVVGSSIEKVKIGTYRVDNAIYNGATIRLSLLDNIEQFDRSYKTSTLVYPATLFEIVQEACLKCGVTLANASQTFPHYNYVISTKPKDESLTFREVLSWCATIAGCFVKCNPNGQLTFSWFDTTILDESASDLDGGTFSPWSGGTTYDGGSFNPWSEGDTYDGGNLSTDRDVHYITHLWSQNIAMDDVVITKVSVSVIDRDENASQELLTYSIGTAGYTIEVAANDFITKTNAQEIVNWLGAQLIGLRFRKLDVSQLNDPTIESGDVGIVIDPKQNVYRILVTRVNFSISGKQTIVCGAQTPSRNSSVRFTSLTKAYAESRKQFKEEQSIREQLIEQLEQAIASNSGLYTTIVTTSDSSKIYYLHDAPQLIDSKNVWKMTATAWAVTDDWQGTDSATTSAHKWNAGLTVDGTLITSILSAVGVNATWINTGSLSFNRCKGGTLQLGGANNGNGSLEIYNSSNTKYGSWDNSGLIVGSTSSNYFFSVTNVGDVKAKRATFFGEISAVEFGYTPATVPSYPESVALGNGFITFRGYAGSNYVIQAIYQNYTGRGLYFSCSNGTVTFDANEVYVDANFSVGSGSSKSKIIKTKNDGNRLVYCYETATPYYGDIGFGRLDLQGECIISIDDILEEGFAKIEYAVFLQKEGPGDLWVDEKENTYFIVKGTPNLKFSWEVKAAQIGFEEHRLDDVEIDPIVRISKDDAIETSLDDALKELTEFDEETEFNLTQELEQLDNEILF